MSRLDLQGNNNEKSSFSTLATFLKFFCSCCRRFAASSRADEERTVPGMPWIDFDDLIKRTFSLSLTKVL